MFSELSYIRIFYFLDILGIIFFIGDSRTVNGAYDQKNTVCEIMITDHRYYLTVYNFVKHISLLTFVILINNLFLLLFIQ